MKKITSLALLLISLKCHAQTFAYDAKDQLTQVKYSNGSTVNYTYDAVGNRIKEEYKTPVYIFNGNGNWSDASNWLNNEMPPSILPKTALIIIDPLQTGECVLNVSQTISPGAAIKVLANKKFRIPQNLLLQ